MTTTPSTPLITDIAAVLQKDYALGPDSATSIARRVLEMSAAHYAASPVGWSNSEHCPPEDLRGECSGDCAACYGKVAEAMRRLAE